MPVGGQMVTGQRVPAGASIPISVDWPANFGNGRQQQIIVQDQPVNVVLEKMNDLV
jgi:hypothetical protein